MAIAFVNAISDGNDSVTSVTTAPQVVTASNLLVLGAKFRDPRASDTITITNGGAAQTWHGIDIGGGNIYLEDGAVLFTMAMFWAVATATDTITFTMTTGSSHRLPSLSLMQFSGAHATAPLDQVAVGWADDADSVTTASFTPTNAGAVVVSFGNAYSTFNSVIPDTGYSAPAPATDAYSATIAGQYKLAAGTSSQTVTIAQGGNTINSIIAVSFLPAGAASVAPDQNEAVSIAELIIPNLKNMPKAFN